MPWSRNRKAKKERNRLALKSGPSLSPRHEIFCACLSLGLPLATVQYKNVVYFRFVDDVMFSHDDDAYIVTVCL